MSLDESYFDEYDEISHRDLVIPPIKGKPFLVTCERGHFHSPDKECNECFLLEKGRKALADLHKAMEVIKFYADDEIYCGRWMDTSCSCCAYQLRPIIEDDEGQKARDFLKEFE